MTNELTTHNEGDETIEGSSPTLPSEPKHVTFESDAFDPDASALKSIPKQGLQRKGTPMPQAMKAKAHGPLSFPKPKVDDDNNDNDDEEEEVEVNDEEDEVDHDNFDDASMPFKESCSHNDVMKIASYPTRTKPPHRPRQRQETPIPSDMLILTTGKVHVANSNNNNKTDAIVDCEVDSNTAPAPLKESEDEDVFSDESAALPKYTASSSIPKQGLQRKDTPLPQNMVAKAHGSLPLSDGGDKIDEEPEPKEVGFVPDIVGGQTKPRLRQGTPYVKDMESLSEQLLLEPDVQATLQENASAITLNDSKGDDNNDDSKSGGRRATPFPTDLLDMSGTIRAESDVDAIAEEEDMLDSKEVGFVPDIVGGESKPRLRRGTPYVEEMKKLSEQLHHEPDVDPTLQEDVMVVTIDKSKADDDDDDGSDRLGTSGTIGAESEVEHLSDSKQVGFVPDIVGGDAKPRLRLGTPYVKDIKRLSEQLQLEPDVDPTVQKDTAVIALDPSIADNDGSKSLGCLETSVPATLLDAAGTIGAETEADVLAEMEVAEEEVDEDNFVDAPMPLKESSFNDVKIAPPSTRTKRHRQRQETPIPSDMLILTGKVHTEADTVVDCDEDVDDAPAPLKESERDDVFAENETLPRNTALSIPKQGLQRKATPLPQAMIAKARGPLSLPEANIDEDEEDGKEGDDDFDDAPAPLKESDRDDVFDDNATLPINTASSIPKQGLQRKATPLPQAMIAKAHGPLSLPRANVGEDEEDGKEGDDDFDDAPAPLKESERDDVFVENATLPRYTTSSIPKQGLQRKATPLPQAMIAKAHGPLSPFDGDDTMDEEPESKEVGFVADIVGGETKPRRRQGTPYVKDMESLSEQLLLEPQVNATLDDDAAMITRGDSKADDNDDSKSGGRHATPFPTDLLDTSGTIRAESDVDAIPEFDAMLAPNEVGFVPDVVGDDAKPRLRQGTPYVKDMTTLSESVEPGVSSVRVPEKVERDVAPRKGFIPNLLRKLKNPVRTFRNVAK